MPNDAREERAKIRSKVTQFPDAVLDKIDEELRRGRGATMCLKVLKTDYQGPLVLPSRDTMEGYIRARRPQVDAAVARRLEQESKLSNLPDIPDLRRVVAGGNLNALLSAEMAVRAERIEIIRELQGSLADVGYERVLADNLSKLTEDIEKKLKLETAGGMQGERLRAVVNVLLRHISGAVSQAYRDVHSDNKLDQFVKALDKRIDVLDFDTIEDEVTSAVSDQKKVLNLPEHT